jgi:YidC/Oxa1 family membrane protein insertase
MYDRKTWIVLALCGILLALGMMEQSKQAAALREAERQKQEQAARLKELQPKTPAAADDPAEAPKPPALAVEPPPPPAEEKTVTLETDKMLFTFSNIGGGIKYADFKTEMQVAEPTVPVRVNERGGGPIGCLAGPDAALKNVPYSYDEAASIPGRKVVYVARLDNGLLVRKEFSLAADGPGAPYLLDLAMTIENGGAGPFSLKEWSVFCGDAVPLHPSEMVQHTGVFWYEDDSMAFKNADTFSGGWFGSDKSSLDSPAGQKIQYAGVTNQFFATALRPKEPIEASVWATPSSQKNKSIRAGLRLPDLALNPAERREFAYQIFIGPKLNPMLREMGDGWGDLMQYSGPIAKWFGIAPVARFLNWVLNHMHALMDGVAKKWSWGLAIILLTIIVRTAIWPLYAKSTRTMKRMSKLKPEMERLKQKYPDDPNKLNTEMMGLYRKYGVNPMGGCLPMFVQIPIFFGFYTMLQYAVELRQQGFLWVDDLSMPDTLTHAFGIPINILPVVMAITSFLQIRMTPQTGDATQQKIIMFMPFMFFFFCYNFASALALYWTTQNIFTIGQTWLMNRIPEPELKVRQTPTKKSWMQRMMEQQQALQKQRAQQSSQGSPKPGTETPKKRSPRTGG